MFDTLPRIPSGVTSFEVRAAVGQFVMDSDDSDRAPDLVTVGGKVTITPDLKKPLRVNGATALDTRVVGVNALEFTLDPATGQLVHPDGAVGVELIDPNDENLDPQGWTYTATVVPAVGNRWSVTFGSPADGDRIVNLGALANVDSTGGVVVPPLQQVVAARDETITLAATAEDAAARADSSATYAAAVAYGQPLEVTDTVVTSLATDPAKDLGRTLETRYRRNVTPAEFGAVGDGAADDTDAIRAMLATGRPAYWGDRALTYLITEPLTVNLAGPLSWRGDGATVSGGFPASVERMLTINANGHPVTISGVTFDAARTAFTVLRIWSRYTTAPACVLTDVTALNGHRASTEFPGGDGIVVAGAWGRVTLTRPTVRDMTLAAGAGVSGAYGVGGIYVHDILRADGDYDTPHIVNIADPYVENIYSEDPAYKDDQDGIKVFGGREAAGQTAPIRTHATITGGEVRNALGRAFKAQVEMATVDGLRIVRTMGGKGRGQDLDFQIGGGTVRNLECVYIDASPPTVINFSGSRTAGRTLPQKQVAGLKVVIHGAVAPDWLVSVLSQQEQEVSATINDISVTTNGAVPGHLLRMSGTTEARQRVVLANAVAPVATAAVAADGGTPDGWDGTLVATGLVNPGTVKPLVAAGPLSRMTTTHAGLSGYTA